MGKSSHIHKLHSYTDKELAMTGVYVIVSLINGKMYVGSASHISTVNPSHSGFWGRWNMHLQHLKRNKHHAKYLQRHFNKHGIDSLRFRILGFYNPKHCESAELFWISALNTVESGFNESECTKMMFGKENPNYKHLDDNEVVRKYLELNHVGETAKFFGVGEEKLRVVLDKNNISRRNRIYTNLDYEAIYKEYLQGLSVNKLGSKYGVDKATIFNNFRKLGYKLRYVFSDKLKV